MKFAALAGGLLLVAGSASAANWTFDQSHTRVGFSVDHLGYSLTHGHFEDFKGTVQYDPKKPTATKVSFTIETDSIDTGWDARDDHLEKPEFFNVEKFPTMTFESTQVKMQGKNKAKVTGNLTLLGVTKPVTLDVVLKKHAPSPITKKDTIGFQATTTIKRSDFGMTAYVPAVGDLIPVVIDAELNPAE